MNASSILKFAFRNFSRYTYSTSPYPTLNKIDIQSFESIQKVAINLPFNSHWIFLTGNNGTGKSSILKAIALGTKNPYYYKHDNISENTRINLSIKYPEDIFPQNLSYYITYNTPPSNPFSFHSFVLL